MVTAACSVCSHTEFEERITNKYGSWLHNPTYMNTVKFAVTSLAVLGRDDVSGRVFYSEIILGAVLFLCFVWL